MEIMQSGKQRGDSPTFPEVAECEAEIPMEEAVCASIIDSSLSESEGSQHASPNLNAAIRKELNGERMNTSSLITEKMKEEEERLNEEGVKKEEERQKENQKLLGEVDETTEMRYERLKYLLSKSTLYTEYLVDRMKKQKEEQEKKREKIMKRKSKMQEGEKNNNSENSSSVSLRQNQSRKRTSEETIEKPSKRSRKERKQPLQEASADENDDDHESGNSQEKVSDSPGDEREPALLEKAATFGVEQSEETQRLINGEAVPALQPQLMEGGVLRPYQVEGYSWLKILYENGVNGILADEMGLGKTVQCVAMLSHLVQMGVPGPFLVVAPLSTIPNWLSEFKRFSPKVPTVLYHGGKNQRMNLVRKIRLKHKVKEGLSVQPVVITSYEIAMIDRRYLAYFDWKYLIVDEGHRIKNTHCRLIRELRMYHSTHRLLLTGTPLQNNLAELWSMLNFLLPEIFDDKGSFEMWFDATCINDASTEEQILKQEQGKNILSMLHQILSPFMLRRLKTDVDLCIPPKKEVLVYAPLTKEQNQYYSALVDRTIFSFIEDKSEKPEEKVELNAAGHPKRKSASRIVDYSMMIESNEERRKSEKKTVKCRPGWKALEEEEKELESWIHAVNVNKSSRGQSVADNRPKMSQVTIKMRNVMMQLRKCCNHPYLLEHPLDPKTGELALSEGVMKTSGKMLVLDQMLKELKKRGHKVLIFSQMTRMLDLLEDYCQLRKFDFCRLDGSTHVDDRRDSMSEFNRLSSDKFLFLLSTRAGGLGINLTGADTVIIYDSDWNPQCDLQAQDRCHRIGQTKPVVVYRFVTANTIDQKIIERAAGKRKLEKMVIHKGKFKSGNFITKPKPISPEELKELLQSKDHTSEVKNERFVISSQDLEALLDRSDLYAKWNRVNPSNTTTSTAPVSSIKVPKKTAAKSRGSKSSELFQVMEVEEDSGNMTQAETGSLETESASDGEIST